MWCHVLKSLMLLLCGTCTHVNSINSFNSCSKNKRADTRQPSYILHLTSLRSSLQFTTWRIVVAATLASATLGDVLLARCSGSSLRVNLLPTHLVGELAAALGYAALLAKNLAATVQPSRLRPLAAFSISAVATFRVPRPSGDGYRSALPLATEGTQECRGLTTLLLTFCVELLHLLSQFLLLFR